MKPIVLDAEAFNALAGPDSIRMRSVRRAFDAAAALRRPVLVPAVVLAELYRGPGRNARVDSCLSRESRAIDVRDTDRSFARYVGGVLAAAGAGSELMADAHVVATAVEAGGGIVLEGDRPPPDKVGRLLRLGGPFWTHVRCIRCSAPNTNIRRYLARRCNSSE